MPDTKKEIWYASSMRPYPEDEPWFYDTKNYLPLMDIENHWKELKDEILDFIKEEDSKFLSSKLLYENIDINNGCKAIMFLFWGAKISNQFKKKCPKTIAYLQKMPGLVSLSISQLLPNSTLAEHTGDTNAILRCHLGVDIPSGLPDCGLTVNGEKRSWEEGKWIIFNDAYKHSAINDTKRRRLIVIADFIRPEFIHRKNIICAFILTRHVSYIYENVKFITRMPVILKTILFAFFLGVIYFLKPVYNSFR